MNRDSDESFDSPVGRRLTPRRIAVLYVGFGLALLVVSDLLLPRLVADPRLLRDLQAAKGVVEVVASGLLIYALVASAHRELRAKERAIDEAPVGVSIADPTREDNPLVYVNDGFERITGYPAEECLGRNCRFLQGEGTDPETVDTIRSAIDDERPASVEVLNYRRDGTPFWNRLDIVPVTAGDDTVSHFLGIQQDVTERREREQRLSVLNRVLRHDLRNKLTVVLGQLDPADPSVDRNGTADREGPTDRNETVRRAVEELLDTADQVRHFDALLGESDGAVTTLDPAAVLEERIAALDRPEQVTVTGESSGPEAAPVRAHSTVEAALSEVLAALTDGPDAGCTVRLHTTDDHVTIDVCDDGETLGARDLEAVQQDAETPLGHANGLELWLARWAVEKSGGEFAVHDGDSPTIRLRFRRADEAGDPRVTSTSAAGDGVHGR